MRTAHKLMLSAMAVLVSLAAMAPAASATNQIEVTYDLTNVHCLEAVKNAHVAQGGCLIHAEGEATFRTHLFGMEAVEARCTVELEARIGEEGLGYITKAHWAAHPMDSACNEASFPPCGESETTSPLNDFPWPIGIEWDATGYEAHADICIDPAEFVDCEGELQFRVIEEENEPDVGHETQHVEATDQRIGASSFCEVDFDVETEAQSPHTRIHLRNIF